MKKLFYLLFMLIGLRATSQTAAPDTIARMSKNQTIKLNSFNLTYSGSGKIGIRVNPLQALHVGGQVQIDTLTNGTATDSSLVVSVGVLKKVKSGAIATTLDHTVFTTSDGGTVNLNNHQYNILNGSGAFTALTVNLPSSPENGDVVYLKFTTPVTTVTYGNGTVVDGIISPGSGSLVMLVYDTATTSWY